MKLLILITLAFFGHFAYSQNSHIRFIDSSVVALQLDSLKREFPLIENAPPQYELAIYTALSYYPELKDNKIKFKEKKIKTTLNARPTLRSLLYKRKKRRVYVVRINNLFDQKEIITLDKVNFNAKIGVIGHEFAHFLDYSNRNFFRVVDRGIDYLTTRRKAKFEKEIDELTIKRGLGWQCYEWSCFVHHESDATPEYLEFKRLIYLGPDEILSIMGAQKQE